MLMTCPDRIELSDLQRREPSGVIGSGRSEQRLVLRARIVLDAARGHANTRIASALGGCEDTVRKWRHRWSTSPGLAALADAKTRGSPDGVHTRPGPHPFTTEVRVPVRWLRHRMSRWLDAHGQPMPAPGVQQAAARSAQRAGRRWCLLARGW